MSARATARALAFFENVAATSPGATPGGSRTWVLAQSTSSRWLAGASVCRKSMSSSSRAAWAAWRSPRLWSSGMGPATPAAWGPGSWSGETTGLRSSRRPRRLASGLPASAGRGRWTRNEASTTATHWPPFRRTPTCATETVPVSYRTVRPSSWTRVLLSAAASATEHALTSTLGGARAGLPPPALPVPPPFPRPLGLAPERRQREPDARRDVVREQRDVGVHVHIQALQLDPAGPLVPAR